MMFAYSFLAMTSYNIIQPLTRSKLISSLGAVNIPYVIFGAGLFIGVLMLAYTRFYSLLPRRWALPISQAAMAAVMLTFWTLFRTRPAWADWVSVGFFVWGNLLGVLVISQFWTLANGIYDPRQAKRLFGFIGGGVMLGGMTGSGLTSFIIETVGANTLLLWSALTLIACMVLVSAILGKEKGAVQIPDCGGQRARRQASRSKRAVQLLRQSKQVQIIALVIGFGSLGAAIVDLQLNMAAEGMGGEDQHRQVPGAGPVLRVRCRTRHSGLGHAAHPSVSRDRVCAPDAADHPRRDGDRDHPDRSALGRGDCTNLGSVAALLGGQDDAGSAVPAAAVRTAPGSEAARGRHRGPRVPRPRRHSSC